VFGKLFADYPRILRLLSLRIVSTDRSSIREMCLRPRTGYGLCVANRLDETKSPWRQMSKKSFRAVFSFWWDVGGGEGFGKNENVLISFGSAD